MLGNRWAVAAALAVLLAGCGPDGETGGNGAARLTDPSTDTVTDTRIIDADSEPGNWMTGGRTFREEYYSPLDQIDRENVDDLGLEWVFDLDTSRGQEATPLVLNGIMYFSTAWSKVKAVDAKTGELIWAFDPEVPPEKGAQNCCDAVNRGVQLYDGKVYVATLAGELIALDADTGDVVWRRMTIPEDTAYTITAAPQVGGGLVYIGQGGGDSGLRGYVTAYDAETGERVWRFHLVPGNPADGFENEAMKMAAETWSGEWWKIGGGGTPWNEMAYDPDLGLLYVGAGNAGPWDISVRSPGGGDNLFVASIVALDAETGEYVWHFQNTPGDAWDFTATQPMILADLRIRGETHKVIMQAPKNGYFYVLDRETGEFISAEGIAPINWSLGLDKDGRPTINPKAKYWETGEPFVARPGIGGAHNWQPMSYSRKTGLVYIPAMESPTIHRGRQSEGNNVYGDRNPAFMMEENEKLRREVLDSQYGYLLAWDPVRQEEAWRVDLPGPFNGGTLSTAGNLVFQGEGNGEFAAFDAETGDKLWRMDTYGGIIAAPMAYTVDGEQYIAVLQGWGGGFAMGAGQEARQSGRKRNISRVLAFKLGGDETLPEPPPWPELNPPPLEADEKTVMRGEILYQSNCSRCHGGRAVAGGTITDLRYSAYLHTGIWHDIVLDGALRDAGMIPFADTLSREDSAAIRAYVIARAHEALAAAEQAGE